MKYQNNQNQGGLIALILLLLVLLFRDNLPQEIKNYFKKDCSCEDQNDIIFDVPDNPDLKAHNKEVVVNRELYERANDKDVFNVPDSVINRQLIDGGLVKFSKNAILS
ncbi:MAG: hypothetical protein CMP12_21255 [Zunongwangia sp.]|uniref:Uncharacterized protein n=2 Tax=Zunongwangia profunda TaxID=398743 RepID=D5BF98_ZUNPS|nr:hypothetical protein [Zunongwangia profunda]ADF52996.1 hypothetical protein ZPR_2674 [Zunongwangia profunda SM-A87]MAO38387.1 hypothetical protein [Zunongwangia sp.]MAS70882.1 hypothetical protein [Zunongwangia sp.]HCV79693.1 hypothetical protein [Zunongwangia profunda]|tara:strand:- start:1422 stop:1745 length:324 start_codon:yes stop_codon:yes gene_type:complete